MMRFGSIALKLTAVLLSITRPRSVHDPLAPVGLVFIRGELWRARANGERIEPGTSVRVDQIDEDLVLEVEPADEPVPVA